MLHFDYRHARALTVPTGAARGRATPRSKQKITFGQSDHIAVWHNGIRWRGLSVIAGVPHQDAWFSANPSRRMHVRPAVSHEIQYARHHAAFNAVIVVRSRHDRMWNTVGFLFQYVGSGWCSPATDEEALHFVGRSDPATMLNAALLAISYRYVSHVFSPFEASS